jgi:hypothetical protein
MAFDNNLYRHLHSCREIKMKKENTHQDSKHQDSSKESNHRENTHHESKHHENAHQESKHQERKYYERKHHGRLFIGIIVLLIGLVMLFKVMGILDTSFIKDIAKFWPIGIILLGIALITRTRGVAGIIIILTLILAIYSGGASHYTYLPERTIQKQINSEETIEKVNLEVKFGAGELNILQGEEKYFVDAHILTSDKDEPYISSEIKGREEYITMQRKNDYSHLGNKRDVWNIKLSPNIVYAITLDSGAAAQKIDMRNIEVETLDIKTGASSSELLFGDYPTKVTINAGASSINMKFPAKASIVVHANGGLSSFEMHGFRKEGNYYYSPDYDANSKSITVDIETGMSSVEGELIIE